MKKHVVHLINEIKKGKILFLFPHPDDEILSCSSLFRICHENGIVFTIAWVTRGVPKYDLTLQMNPNIYARTREVEFSEAKKIYQGYGADIKIFNFFSREIIQKAKIVSDKLKKLIISGSFDTIFIPPYEGAHPDHDLLNYLVDYDNRYYFSSELRLIEYSSYFMKNQTLVNNVFSIKNRGEVFVNPISNNDICLKNKLISLYKSQHILTQFKLKNELFRDRYLYDYQKDISDEIYYESWQKKIRHSDVLAVIHSFIDV